jgi:predicted HAD superfamily Cof-like phosphohydrolase
MNHMFEDCGMPGCTGETKKCGFKGCDRYHPNECSQAKGEWLCTEHQVPETLQHQVIQFMMLAGQAFLPKPERPAADVVKLRMRLIVEEVCELLEAAGVDFVSVRSARGELFTAIDRWDPSTHKFKMIDWVDALTDIDYVVEGARLAFGIFGKPFAAEVHKKNMEKFGPGGYRDAHGKWRKPPDWTPPDIERILREQGWEGDE